jgi:hypothetical protein
LAKKLLELPDFLAASVVFGGSRTAQKRVEILASSSILAESAVFTGSGSSVFVPKTYNDYPANRARSLWDIMNTFYVTGFTFIVHEVSRAKVAFTLEEQSGRGMQPPSGQPVEIIARVLNEFAYSIPADMTDCTRALDAARTQWNTPFLNVSRAAQILARLEQDLVDGTKSREFLWIAADREKMVDQDALFGMQVFSQFPSARKDITEAGNCLAAECSTACVFHLMRAAEIGLRALAVDRDVVFANKPIDQQEWGTILDNLDSKLKAIRAEDIKNWTSSWIKDVQARFYGEVIQEVRGFNEAWRRHLSHARDDAFYDRDYAADVMKHVKKFLQKLSTKISEDHKTSKYWAEVEAS